MMKKHGIEDITSIIREAILDEAFLDDSAGAKLLLSSLEVSPIGNPSSGRIITPMQMPESINVTRVVNDWLLLCPDKTAITCDSDTKEVLTLLAGVVNSNMRACACAALCIKSIASDGSVEIKKPVEKIKLFKEVIHSVSERYYNLHCPSLEIMYSIIFKKSIKLKAEGVTDAILGGLIANSVKDFSENSIIEPASSLLILISALSKALRTDAPLAPINDLFYALLKDISEYEKIWDALERLAHRWMRVRLYMLGSMRGKFSLQELLGISNLANFESEDMQDLLKKKYTIHEGSLREHQMKSSSYSAKGEPFLRELKSVQVNR